MWYHNGITLMGDHMRAVTHKQAIIDRALDQRAPELRMAALELEQGRRAMQLAAALEWYGADLELAMRMRDSVLFNTTVNRIRQVGRGSNV